MKRTCRASLAMFAFGSESDEHKYILYVLLSPRCLHSHCCPPSPLNPLEDPLAPFDPDLPSAAVDDVRRGVFGIIA